MDTSIKEDKLNVNQAVEILAKALSEDPELYLSWQTNLEACFAKSLNFKLVPFISSTETVCILTLKTGDKAATQAAKSFLTRLIGSVSNGTYAKVNSKEEK